MPKLVAIARMGAALIMNLRSGARLGKLRKHKEQ
jgi:hypothetical protein